MVGLLATLAREPKGEANRLKHRPVAISPQDAIPKNDGFHDSYLFVPQAGISFRALGFSFHT